MRQGSNNAEQSFGKPLSQYVMEMRIMKTLEWMNIELRLLKDKFKHDVNTSDDIKENRL